MSAVPTPETGFWNVARAHPERVAIIEEGGRRFTYKDLAGRANQLVHLLRRRGLGRGDGIAILQPNCAEFMTAVLAAAQAGLYYTPVNHNLLASEIAYILQNSEAKAFIAHERFADKAISAVDESGVSNLTCIAVGEVAGFPDYEELLAQEPPDPPADRQAGSLLAYTSGTTGRPKGVRRPLSGLTPEQQDVVAMPMNMLAVLGLPAGEDNVHLCVSPLYHNAPGGYASFALQLGHTLVLMEKFKPEPMLRVVQEQRVTSTHMVPIQFHRLLELPEDVRNGYDLSRLRLVAHAGAPCPPDVKRRMIEWLGPIVYEYYSASEGVGGTVASPQDALERPGTVGRPYREGSLVKILDDDGKELPAGEIGTIYTSVAGAGFRYFKDDAKSESARRGELFTVGDFGRVDEDGYLYLVSRRTDLILSGGVNIYPAEVEGVLAEHPAVSDAAVFGIPSEEWGEEVKAVVQPAPGAAGDPDLAAELIAHCRARLAAFKAPKTVDFLEELPRDPNGKLYKRNLRDPYWVKADAE
jgi:long-chain acyl-CoA synthetase